MKVLFIGGSGIISSACSQLAVEQGLDLYLLNRGQSSRPVPREAGVLRADVWDMEARGEVLRGLEFDVVVNWIVFTPEQLEADIQFFHGRVGQYIFISSASVYQKPPAALPITESTPLDNPYWEYSQRKIACEERLVQAYHQEKFPATVVRPSHTYDRTLLPCHGGWTVIDRMRRGLPVVVHGDGTSLWVLTHHADFARGFNALLGNPHALGSAIHITSDELLTWNQIYETLARAAGCTANLVHVASDAIAAFDPEWGAGLLGDKAHSVIFDNTKIKRLAPGFSAGIPFARGAEEIIAWYDADASRRKINPGFNQLLDRILAVHAPAREM